METEPEGQSVFLEAGLQVCRDGLALHVHTAVQLSTTQRDHAVLGEGGRGRGGRGLLVSYL